jgi:ectoine hydroxylase-related dioxygenase (phytanoyl-CoA dioxygenase family)
LRRPDLATKAKTPKIKSDVERYSTSLLEEGFVVIRNAMDPEIIRALDVDLAQPFACTPFSQGNFFGGRTVRFGRGLLRSDHAISVVQNGLILSISEKVLSPWCDSIQLNLTQGIAVHPRAPAQLPHRDQDMWSGPKGEIQYTVNVIWPLVRFRRANGATRVWSGSHRKEKDRYLIDDDVFVAEMEVGDALIFLGSTLHAQGANDSDEIRRAFVVGYSLSWLKPYDNNMLAYPPHIARRFSPELADLIGYKQLPANLNNFEGRSPSILLQDEVPEHFGFVDEFHPDQVAAIDYYLEHRKPRLA